MTPPGLSARFVGSTVTELPRNHGVANALGAAATILETPVTLSV